MDALTIRRYKGLSTPQYQAAPRTEKSAAAVEGQKVNRSTGLAVSETLRQLMSKVSQVERHIRESHRTLQTGETVLDEVRSSLDRIGQLAEEAAGGGEPDRAALQEEVERLRDEIGRMLSSAVAGDTRLFLDEEAGIADDLEALLQAITDGSQGKEEVQPLPDWLVKGMTMGAPTRQQLLTALGLDQNASGAQLLAAIADHPPESNPATAYLATLYLGTVIAGGDPAEGLDPQLAMEGLQKLLEEVQDGTPLDEAIELLTDGAFTSMADFQAQFTDGTAPGLEQFLVNLLLTSGEAPALPESPGLNLPGGLAGLKLELMLTLLDALPGAEKAAAEPTALISGNENGAAGANGTAGAGATVTASTSILQFGNVLVIGRDLSGVSFDTTTGLLTVGGSADVTIRGMGQDGPPILLTSSGTVTLQAVRTPALTVGTALAQIFTTGATSLQEVQLQEGSSLTLGSGGRLEIGVLHGNRSNALHLTGGSVIVAGKANGAMGTLSVPVFLDGAVSLAAHAVHVSSGEGRALEPFDLIWKTLLPGWSSITSMMIDGRQAKMSLLGGEISDPARLWLAKDDGSHGFPVHTVAIRGRDRSGQAQTRYAFLRWNQQLESFQEIGMYPNPFTVTGGQEYVDWIYDELTQTLRILSNQVTAISGGIGTDAEQVPFSGRIALADRIGAMRLDLNGVVCQVSHGRAFSLGRENDVTLILRSGADNLFQSGAGCAGISVRESTALCIDCAASRSSRDPTGTLTATGGAGGAGIGRDSGGSKDRTSRILIQGGVITAAGTDGGAGIGAGRRGFMGAIVITGGIITATGGAGGGAGIGGALGAPVGDISISGGTITASAVGHAAAIGAGMQGASGDISITGSTRILKALGGDPGADIGGSLFGGCGNVSISGGADIGCARLRRRSGVPLRMGETTVTLPQFRLSPRTLRLDRLNVLTREYAQTAVKTIDTDRRWIAQIQSVYSALYTQLEQSRFHNAKQYVNVSGGMVRDSGAASALLKDMSRSIPAQTMSTYGKRDMDDVRRLLW